MFLINFFLSLKGKKSVTKTTPLIPQDNDLIKNCISYIRNEDANIDFNLYVTSLSENLGITKHETVEWLLDNEENKLNAK